MSRAGAKLYGYWNGPEGEALERAGRRRFWATMSLATLAVVIGGSALFGFG